MVSPSHHPRVPPRHFGAFEARHMEVTRHVVKFSEASGEMTVTVSHQDKVRLAAFHRLVLSVKTYGDTPLVSTNMAGQWRILEVNGGS